MSGGEKTKQKKKRKKMSDYKDKKLSDLYTVCKCK